MRRVATWLQKFLLCGLVLSLAYPCLALTPPSPQAPHKPISESDIIDLLQAGVSPTRVATLADQMGINFVLTEDVERRLRNAGATEEILGVLRRRSVASAQAAEHFDQGRRLSQQGDYGGALREFEAAEKLAPLWPQVPLERAAALDATKRHADAALAWKRYLELAPAASDHKQVEERLQEKIHVLLRQGFDAFTARRFGEPEDDNAIYWARQVRRIEPDHTSAKELETQAATAWENQAKIALSQKQFDQALQIYQKLAALFPENSTYLAEIATLNRQAQTTPLLARAQNALNAGQYGEPPGENAIELARQVLQADPTNAAAKELETRAAAAYEGLARRALEGNDRKRALEIYTRLLSLFPGREEFRRGAESLQSISLRAMHYHGVRSVGRFPFPKFANRGCWGYLKLTAQGLQYEGNGGNDTRVDNFSFPRSALGATSGAMARPGALDGDFAGSGIHMTHLITVTGQGGENKFYVSQQSISEFQAFSAEFWGWKWGPTQPTTSRRRK